MNNNGEFWTEENKIFQKEAKKRRKFLRDLSLSNGVFQLWLEFNLSNRDFHRSTLDAFKRGALQLKHRARVISSIDNPARFSSFFEGKKKIATSFRHVYEIRDINKIKIVD